MKNKGGSVLDDFELYYEEVGPKPRRLRNGLSALAKKKAKKAARGWKKNRSIGRGK